MRSIHECADRNTVVGTVASASFMPGLLALATSAANVGFPCVVVQPFDWFETLRHQLIRSLPVPSPPLLPRSVWCMSEHQREYGWRRSQLHRVRMWRLVLEERLDLLAMDLDHQLGPRSPVDLLLSLHAPPESHSWLPPTRTSSLPAPADVIAVWDGPGQRYLNVGLMWIRSTAGTRELARRSENRSWVGWEQQVFNEELNFNEDLTGVRCCHTTCLKKLSQVSNATRDLPTKSSSGTSARQKAEGHDRCHDDAPYAAAPPQKSTEPWVKSWTANADVLRSRHAQNRKFGRCNHDGNVCVQVDSSGMIRYMASSRTSSATDAAPASNCSTGHALANRQPYTIQ